jgi:crotonobetainyl-CoA:carnitine CoA-transferase CaiB-like acyl-CoA transferase
VFDVMVADWTRAQTAAEIVKALDAQRVPVEQVVTPDRMYDLSQLEARGYYAEVAHPITGKRRYPGWPFRVTPGPSRHHRSAPPMLGQHNDEVLRGLGLTDDELADLRAHHVIGETALNA